MAKEIDYLSDDYRAWIEASPLAALATIGAGGLDASPRGDRGHLVVVADSKTLYLPDRRGNNRLDSLRNIIEDPRVALLFLLPGLGETLRVNGRARLSVNPELCQSLAIKGKVPRSVIVNRG